MRAAILALALLALAALAQSADCPPGTFVTLDDDFEYACAPCPVGSFNDAANASACTPCAAGATTLGAGATQCVVVDDGDALIEAASLVEGALARI